MPSLLPGNFRGRYLASPLAIAFGLTQAVKEPQSTHLCDDPDAESISVFGPFSLEIQWPAYKAVFAWHITAWRMLSMQWSALY